MKLQTKILIGLVLGIVVGLIFGPSIAVIKPVGDIFIRLLRMLVVPIVVATLIAGVASAGDSMSVGRLGLKSLIYYIITTTTAIAIGLFLVNVISPGSGFIMPGALETAIKPPEVTATQLFVNLVPINPIEAMAKADMLQVIVFSITVGLALVIIGERGKPVTDFFDGFSQVMFTISTMVINLAPYGVFALIAVVVGNHGLSVLMPMAKLVLTVYLGCILYILLVTSSLLRFVAKINPLLFFKAMFEPGVIGFTTCSQAAAFPVFFRIVHEVLGVPKKIASFVLSTALTINLDGTALYQAAAAVFVAQVYGIELTIAQQLTILLGALLASIATASIPGGGFVMLAMVLTTVGLPIEGIALVAGIDRILDMARTTVNCLANPAGAVVIASMEGEFDPKYINNYYKNKGQVSQSM